MRFCPRHVLKLFEGSILSSLRALQVGHTHAVPPPKEDSPFEIFYNIYKPNTPLRKTAPPPPDFQCVVVE
jgi:tRNA-splicing endonuclease subunit Sen54